MPTGLDARVYFAASPRHLIGQRLVGRLSDIASVESPQEDLYASAYRHYYGQDAGYGTTTGVTRGGEQGELALLRIGRARSLAKAYLALVTAQKVTWRPLAKNGDAGAAAATALAQNLLEDFWSNKGLSRVFLHWVEQAIVFSQAFVFAEWDLGAGPPLAPRNGRMVLQGDVTLHNILPWNSVTDPATETAQKSQWRAVRLFKSRWDLVETTSRLVSGDESLPDITEPKEIEDRILNASEDSAMKGLGGGRMAQDGAKDLVPVWHFHHQPCPALPRGREVVLLAGNCVLRDGPLSYAAPGPVYRLAADEKFDTPDGHSAFWETLGAQEIADDIQTTLASIITNMGKPIVATEMGADETPTKLPSGFRSWRYPKGGKPPESVNLAEFPKDALEYSEQLAANQAQVMGLNDVALGQPKSAQMNAQAFAVLASMAAQQAAPFQTQMFTSLAELGTGILKTLRKRVSRPRQLKIVGKSSQNLFTVEEFSGEDLEAFDSVIMGTGDPMEQTPAGRLQKLQLLMQVPGAVTTAEQVQQVMDTGRLEPAVKSIRDAQTWVDAECEQLQRGQKPTVHAYDNHPLHYREHARVLMSPARENAPEIVQATQLHNDEHYLNYFGIPPDADPLRLGRQRFLLGQGPEPMPMMPPGAPPGATAPPESGAPPPMGEGPSPATPPQGPIGAPPGPQMPTNPVDGQQFNPAGGPPLQ